MGETPETQTEATILRDAMRSGESPFPRENELPQGKRRGPEKTSAFPQ